MKQSVTHGLTDGKMTCRGRLLQKNKFLLTWRRSTLCWPRRQSPWPARSRSPATGQPDYSGTRPLRLQGTVTDEIGDKKSKMIFFFGIRKSLYLNNKVPMTTVASEVFIRSPVSSISSLEWRRMSVRLARAQDAATRTVLFPGSELAFMFFLSFIYQRDCFNLPFSCVKELKGYIQNWIKKEGGCYHYLTF